MTICTHEVINKQVLDDGISGIYSITNLVNDKVYVGSAVDIKARWYSHKSELRRGVHPNSLLQRSWSKYGEEKFLFDVIEEVIDKSKLLEREQYFIDSKYSYKREIGFNLRRNANSNYGLKFSKSTRDKMSKVRLGELNHFHGRSHTKTAKKIIGDATRGSKKWCAKLDDDKVRDIRRRYESKQATQVELTHEYGVSDGVISRVCNYKTWRHVV